MMTTTGSAMRVAAIALLWTALAGCTIQVGGGNAKRIPTAAELKPARSASVKYYADNSFAFQTDKTVVWSAVAQPQTTAIALGIRKEAYNLVDVQAIRTASVQRGNISVDEVTVTLRNGTTLTENLDAVAWLVCERAKGCFVTEPMRNPITPRQRDFIVASYSISKAELAQPFAGRSPSTRYEYSGLDFGTAAANQYFTAIALSAEEAREHHARIAAWKRAWQEGAPAREAADAARRSAEQRAAEARWRAEDEKRKAQQAKRVKELQSVRVGTMTLCTTEELTDEIKNATQLSCPGFGDSYVQQMLDVGWTITAIVPASQSQSLGVFSVVRTRYNITFQKAK